MALTIGTNVASLQASAAASSVNRDLETSMARLSTGKRINSAADDAAGVAIASRLSSEIRGTDQAIRNALDGQALIDTAEGGHKEIEAILQRMREVSVQAASDTNNTQDRGNLQAEMDALSTEIDRIAGVTTWAGNSVMDGGGGATTTATPASKTFSLQVGAATGTKNQIDVAINAMDASTLSVGVTVATADALETDANATTETNAAFTAATAGTGNSATDPVHSVKARFVISGTSGATLRIGALTSLASTVATAAGAATDLVSKINDDSTYQGAGISAAIKSGTTDTIELTQNLTKSHVMSADAAKQSITNIDAAILAVNTQRSELGAISNRLTHTVSNMTNISTNLSAARGGIEDADFALETTNLAKNQILQQASTAMLAQANASKQNVLSLLRG
jgi:flagellin